MDGCKRSILEVKWPRGALHRRWVWNNVQCLNFMLWAKIKRLEKIHNVLHPGIISSKVCHWLLIKRTFWSENNPMSLVMNWMWMWIKPVLSENEICVYRKMAINVSANENWPVTDVELHIFKKCQQPNMDWLSQVQQLIAILLNNTYLSLSFLIHIIFVPNKSLHFLPSDNRPRNVPLIPHKLVSTCENQQNM